jgi:hypothetical protein
MPPNGTATEPAGRGVWHDLLRIARRAVVLIASPIIRAFIIVFALEGETDVKTILSHPIFLGMVTDAQTDEVDRGMQAAAESADTQAGTGADRSGQEPHQGNQVP